MHSHKNSNDKAIYPASETTTVIKKRVAKMRIHVLTAYAPKIKENCRMYTANQVVTFQPMAFIN
ncbi:hypothetical protein V1478_004709 [Vespula squamosa]|uniref:Uncharacterized protein n=1 Tax=Vespula squamosa TaxID=30214 RepID=A0ABD2BGY2_VESSQ